ncbi:hypothetical protein ACFL4P_00560 [Gemmatimonadota bacterium]
MNKMLSLNKMGPGYLILESTIKVIVIAGLIVVLGWSLVQLGAWMDM